MYSTAYAKVVVLSESLLQDGLPIHTGSHIIHLDDVNKPHGYQCSFNHDGEVANSREVRVGLIEGML